MRKVLIAALSTAVLFGMAGCAGGEGASSDTPDTSIILTEEQVDKPLAGDQNEVGDNLNPTDVIASENPSEDLTGNPPADPSDKTSDSKPADSGEPAEANAVPGTWQTNSINTEEGTAGPEYYIQFTSSDIKYGHMKDGAFVEEYSDKISHLEKTVDGKYLVQAESKSGVKYTFKTSESDVNTMEYYGTWTEAEFASTYSASGSITKTPA